MSTSDSPGDERLPTKDYTPHFHDWYLWQAPEDGNDNFCDSLDCPQCLSPLRPVQHIFSETYWCVCPECHTKYRRYIAEEVSFVEADPRDELIIAMWTRIQQLEQRVQQLERQSPPTRPALDSEIASNTIAELPQRYRSLLKSK